MTHPVVTAVRVVNDSVRVVLSTPIHVPEPKIVVMPEAHAWSSSPLIQTFLGGLLAVGAGIATEMFREWRRGHKLRHQLAKEVDMLVAVLGELDHALEGDGESVRERLADIDVLRDGFNRSHDSLATLLEPFVLRDVNAWYARLRFFGQGTMARAVGLIQARDRNEEGAAVIADAHQGLVAARKETRELVAEGGRLATVLRAFRPRR